MQLPDILNMVLTILAAIPAVGPILSVAAHAALGLVAVSTCLVTAWHAVIALLSALSSLPGCASLAALATKLKASESKVDDFEQATVLPILNRLSILAPPVAKAVQKTA